MYEKEYTVFTYQLKNSQNISPVLKTFENVLKLKFNVYTELPWNALQLSLIFQCKLIAKLTLIMVIKEPNLVVLILPLIKIYT